MTLMLHLAPAKERRRIEQAGIRTHPALPGVSGVFAMPVVPNHFHTHQWMRELRKWRAVPMIGVYVRIPDDEIVHAGRYNGQHQAITAAQAAAGLLRGGDAALGYEVIVPHAIPPAAIQRIRRLPRVIGWRHYPGAHGRRPCGCPACVVRGQYKARRLRAAYERGR
ncbi:MAG TPA: hypothetical protein VGR57_18435 [Ktedonobacterales bacterium]|nr:hypothetical protein [Ktedonobacterales bacterium]